MRKASKIEEKRGINNIVTRILLTAFLLAVISAIADGSEYDDIWTRETFEYVDLHPYYTERHDTFDGGYRGFYDYFDVENVIFNDIPFQVEPVPSPYNVLSSEVWTTSRHKIDINSDGPARLHMLGVGTHLADYLGHKTLWCDELEHFSFELHYTDGTMDEVFPINYITGLARWGDILYSYGAVCSFPASPIGYVHQYYIDAPAALDSVVMCDKFTPADYTVLALTVEYPDVCEGEMTVEPSTMPFYWAYSVGTMEGSLYFGNLCEDMSVSDINIETIRINGCLKPLSCSLISQMEGFSGEVMQVQFPLNEFIGDYLPIYWEKHVACEISGFLSEGRLFKASCYVTIQGIHADPKGDIFYSTGNQDRSLGLPEEFGLSQNYPNPFNPTTTIEFTLPRADDYRLIIYDVLGREKASFDGSALAGEKVSITWDASGAASGIYFYRLETNGYSQTRKMSIIK